MTEAERLLSEALRRQRYVLVDADKMAARGFPEPSEAHWQAQGAAILRMDPALAGALRAAAVEAERKRLWVKAHGLIGAWADGLGFRDELRRFMDALLADEPSDDAGRPAAQNMSKTP